MVREELEDRVQPYLAPLATERDMLADNAAREGGATGKATKARGGQKKVSIELYSSDYLRKLYAAFRKGGVEALVDSLSKSGNRTSQFRPEEQALLMEIVTGSYLTTERKSIKATVIDVQRGFHAENARRADQGLVPLRVPGRDAVRRAIKRLGEFRVMVARYGLQHAMKKLRPVGKGLDISPAGRARRDGRMEDRSCLDNRLGQPARDPWSGDHGGDRTRQKEVALVAIRCNRLPNQGHVRCDTHAQPDQQCRARMSAHGRQRQERGIRGRRSRHALDASCRSRDTGDR